MKISRLSIATASLLTVAFVVLPAQARISSPSSLPADRATRELVETSSNCQGQCGVDFCRRPHEECDSTCREQVRRCRDNGCKCSKITCKRFCVDTTKRKKYCRKKFGLKGKQCRKQLTKCRCALYQSRQPSEPTDAPSCDSHPCFADSLTALLYEPQKNQCSSCLGVSMALDIVLPGMDTESAKQTSGVLGLRAGSAENLVWEETASRLDAAYNGDCAYDNNKWACEHEQNMKPTLEIANSVWIDDGTALDEKYEAIVGDFAHPIPFYEEEAGGTINEWVEDNTNGLIKKVVDDGPIPRDMFLIAINTIYLKANWESPFEDRKTNEDTFYTTPARQLSVGNKVHFMHKVGNCLYSHNALPGYQILMLPFKGNTLHTLFVLPTADTVGLAKSSEVLTAIPNLASTSVAVALPRFKFESKYKDDLMDSLKSLGMAKPFTCESDCPICGLVQGLCGYISLILQKTFIDLHETGVEAAAATVVGVSKTSVEPIINNDAVLFLANHPFQFFIYEETEELVIFEGHVVNPGIASDAPDPKLKALHSDKTFWIDNFSANPKAEPSH